MPVTGLVIVLDRRSTLSETAIDEIRRHGRFTLGPPADHGRLPAVLETDSVDEDRRDMKWINTLPGVAMVEVAYFDFRDVVPDDAAGATGGQRDADGTTTAKETGHVG